VERLPLETQLRRALEREELVLHYQPKQDFVSGCVTGMEALVRWQHPDHGMVAPADFIPLAEETGLIVPMGKWVLRKACEDTAQLVRSHRMGALRVAVNLSAPQFSDDHLIELVSETLREFGVEASLLEVEVTESMVMRNAEHAARLLARLKVMGVHVAMDDFGTGYSSLAGLNRFPIDTIKIDRTFIQGLPGDNDDATLTKAIIAMAHSLRLKTVAEGVETREQLEFLRGHGCDEIQGYYFSPPQPFDGLEAMLRKHHPRPPVMEAADARTIAVWP
jgi:EAL domain-containing protein (putative c-di-GMP-specific phosphodiesterase class I)